METMNFVRAVPNDVMKLRPLASQSEAHWGYSDTFMKTFDETFNITEKFILENPTYVLWEENEPIAFWGLTNENYSWELEYFYVSSSILTRGFGRIMWKHMVEWCKDHKVDKIHFVTSPQAVGFYEKMGAILDGMTESTIDRRQIPHFVYQIKM